MRHRWTAIRLFTEITLAIMVAEAAVMFALPHIAPGLEGWREAFFDAALLAMLAGPVVLWRCYAASLSGPRPHAPAAEPQGHRHRRAGLTVLATLCLGVPFAFGVARVVWEEIDHAAQDRFEAIAHEVDQELDAWTSRPIYGMLGARGLFIASEQVTADEFSRFITSRDLETEFPGVEVMGAIDLIDAEAPAPDHERRDSAHGLDHGGPHWRVKFAEPSEAGGALRGVDLCGDPVVLEAIGRAARTGEPTLCVAAGSSWAGGPREMMWLVPVYRSGAEPTTEYARLTSLDTVIFTTFDLAGLGDVLEEALDGSASLDVYLGDKPDLARQAPFVQFDPRPGRRPLVTRERHLNLGGQNLTLLLGSTPAFERTIGHETPVLVAIFGMALAVACAAAFYGLSTSRYRAIRMADQMTQKIRRLSMVAEKTTNAVIVTDPEGRIEWVNEGFTKMSGYSFAEALGQNAAELRMLDGESLESTRKEIREAFARGEGYHAEMQNRAKDGSAYWVSLDVQPILGDDGGEVTGYIGVESDLTEQKQLEQDLREATSTAIAANEAKSRFLSSMSHEIRTPLNGIIGFADLLRRGAHNDDPETQAEWIGVIHGSGQHLLSLLNDVLDLSKLDAEGADIALAPCNPMAMISESVMLMQSRADEKGIGLDLEFEERVPTAIRTDATRVRQILMNLISNAVKFTDKGAVTVRVSHFRRGGERLLKIDVEDTGIGMSKSQMDKLFRPFQQADKNIAERFGGTGLGLSISKTLAKKLGGDITVTSTPTVGSVFTVTFAAPPLLRGESLPSLIPDRDAWDNNEASPLEGATVLVVDDVAENRKVASLFLQRAGAEVRTANDGAAALELCRNENYDLVLMDVQMPVMSGIQAAEAIRALGKEMPILALTAFSSGADRGACLAAGMNDFLAKPFEPTVLVQSSARWVQYSRGQLEHAPDVDMLDTMGDDPELVAVALDWLEGLTSKLDTISTAIETGDAETVGRVGHAIKGSGGSLGMPEFTAPATELESAAEKGDFDGARRHLQKLIATQASARSRLAA